MFVCVFACVSAWLSVCMGASSSQDCCERVEGVVEKWGALYLLFQLVDKCHAFPFNDWNSACILVHKKPSEEPCLVPSFLLSAWCSKSAHRECKPIIGRCSQSWTSRISRGFLKPCSEMASCCTPQRRRAAVSVVFCCDFLSRSLFCKLHLPHTGLEIVGEVKWYHGETVEDAKFEKLWNGDEPALTGLVYFPLKLKGFPFVPFCGARTSLRRVASCRLSRGLDKLGRRGQLRVFGGGRTRHHASPRWSCPSRHGWILISPCAVRRVDLVSTQPPLS